MCGLDVATSASPKRQKQRILIPDELKKTIPNLKLPVDELKNPSILRNLFPMLKSYETQKKMMGERRSSPSIKKIEEEGIKVIHEVKCKLYVKVSVATIPGVTFPVHERVTESPPNTEFERSGTPSQYAITISDSKVAENIKKYGRGTKILKPGPYSFSPWAIQDVKHWW
ncbi:uncharacterized protein LOC132284842 isoform X2 [Cornus florida]|uniref:uncharacterized protein LOC132284842 isoform X2 n=1 Tax=Cornus florida TaxID=4283 RepID=UPI0028A13202|nr:uncharacterized protein LOC132284842 isoform X2 [Cornus florida]